MDPDGHMPALQPVILFPPLFSVNSHVFTHTHTHARTHTEIFYASLLVISSKGCAQVMQIYNFFSLFFLVIPK